jgi:DNA-directed RNA polymerase specialized sigma24 family protein
VLQNLFLEWVRTAEDVAVVSLDAPGGEPDLDGKRTKSVHEVYPTVEPPDTVLVAKAELERKLAWRYLQQAKLRVELQTYHVRPSCKEIASLLNVSLGSICSKIARARAALGNELGFQEQ